MALFVVFLMIFSTGCGKKSPTWQEQYDLGLRYLTEGNYEEAIIAFTAAIEIDPKKPEAYLRAAEAYEAAGDSEAAKEILEKGYAATKDESLRQEIDEKESATSSNDSPFQIDFDSLSETGKKTVSTLIELVQMGDEESLFELIDSPDVEDLYQLNYYMRIEDKKFYVNSGTDVTDSGYTFSRIEIQLREKDGRGYYIRIWFDRLTDPSQKEVIYLGDREYSYESYWIEFQCSDWKISPGELIYKRKLYEKSLSSSDITEYYSISFAQGNFTGLESVDIYEYEWRYNNIYEKDAVQTGTLSYDYDDVHLGYTGTIVASEGEDLPVALAASWLSPVLDFSDFDR